MKNNKILFVPLGILIIIIFSYIYIRLFKHYLSAPLTTSNNKTIKVSTSFYPLYFLAAEIGKEKVEVKNITPADSEPHDYEPTAKEIGYIENSDIFISNGGRFEPWRDKVINNINNRKTILVTPAEDLIINNDPHVWLSPFLFIKEVEPIKEAFIFADPANKSFYEENASRLIEKLHQIDQQYESGLNDCQQKDIITSHAAFSYLAERYNFNQVSIAGISPDEEPSAHKLADISNLVKQKGIKIIFYESLVSPKLSETIANEIGAETLVLNPLEGITDDDIKQGKNYFSIMLDNLHNLQIALVCTK